ncbi:hypothetical protein BU14_0234s0037 [Porphyra umbilicalis]|uniref:Uncharacterized protein n=1 Tax=Porphyra umbilicalis TaxID=2786 RepID=A0A1X6P430_PORUM|nr:hypothetical protein BU14_0234s0037 [Porphyra umbilicalis]|eukprot:OSX75510.1 hypothetical protein BU14_0234s0037 [Porphyra umbilicalis]
MPPTAPLQTLYYHLAFVGCDWGNLSPRLPFSATHARVRRPPPRTLLQVSDQLSGTALWLSG